MRPTDWNAIDRSDPPLGREVLVLHADGTVGTDTLRRDYRKGRLRWDHQNGVPVAFWSPIRRPRGWQRKASEMVSQTETV